MLELNEEAKNKPQGSVGLMCRHSQARQELKARIEDGELGQILNLRAYRMQKSNRLLLFGKETRRREGVDVSD